MDEYTHDILGSYVYNEQIRPVTGKARISPEGYLEAVINEPSEKLTYTLEGSIIVLDKLMVIDAMEVSDNDSHILYYMEKDIAGPSEAEFDGKYIGQRYGDVYLTSDFEFDEGEGILTPDDIVKKLMSARVRGKEGSDIGRPAVMEFRRIKRYNSFQ